MVGWWPLHGLRAAVQQAVRLHGSCFRLSLASACYKHRGMDIAWGIGYAMVASAGCAFVLPEIALPVRVAHVTVNFMRPWSLRIAAQSECPKRTLLMVAGKLHSSMKQCKGTEALVKFLCAEALYYG